MSNQQRIAAFVSRHTPTAEQIELAASHGLFLDYVGDRDAFDFDPSEFEGFHCVVCVHPMIALRVQNWVATVGIFENEMRAKEGAAPTFLAKALHLVPSDWFVREEHKRGAM